MLSNAQHTTEGMSRSSSLSLCVLLRVCGGRAIDGAHDITAHNKPNVHRSTFPLDCERMYACRCTSRVYHARSQWALWVCVVVAHCTLHRAKWIAYLCCVPLTLPVPVNNYLSCRVFHLHILHHRDACHTDFATETINGRRRTRIECRSRNMSIIMDIFFWQHWQWSH